MSQETYEQLEAACDHLKKSERGRKALENLGQFFRDGGVGLDGNNQRAAMLLFLASQQNPWDLPAHLMVDPKGKRR